MPLVVLSCLLCLGTPTDHPASPRYKSGEPLSGAIVGIVNEGIVLGRSGLSLVPWERLDLETIAILDPIALHFANGDILTARVVKVEGEFLELDAAHLGTLRVATRHLMGYRGFSITATESEREERVALETVIQETVQDPVAKKTILEPKEWSGKIALLGTLRAGNVESTLVSLRTEFRRQWEEDRFYGAFNASYGETEGELVSSSIYSEAKFDHYYSEDFYVYANGSALFDEVADINLRAIFGVGAGMNLWRGETAPADEFLDLEAGISAIYEDFATSTGSDLDPAMRVTFTYRNIILKDVRLGQTFEFVSPFADLGAYIIRAVTSVSVPLSESWSLNNSLEVQYQGEPAPGADPLDLTLLVGIEYVF